MLQQHGASGRNNCHLRGLPGSVLWSLGLSSCVVGCPPPSFKLESCILHVPWISNEPVFHFLASLTNSAGMSSTPRPIIRTQSSVRFVVFGSGSCILGSCPGLLCRTGPGLTAVARSPTPSSLGALLCVWGKCLDAVRRETRCGVARAELCGSDVAQVRLHLSTPGPKKRSVSRVLVSRSVEDDQPRRTCSRRARRLYDETAPRVAGAHTRCKGPSGHQGV